ncbi:GntR family transcriptional regulator [Ralstonia solanacearum]|uniref:GntR family transcriptional regulator n=1 Tax=Ralstonia solanacearum TaxID=305 RepID=UPI0006DCEE91|nr:GntR family transcriptional regulator [Ralstonia solanacearum]
MSKSLKLVTTETASKSGAKASGTTRMSVEERMYREIYDAIMEHRLPPRTKLTEHALCEIYATARHTVRKVFSLLAADGLVDLEPNRGAFIAAPSIDEAHAMFELRQILERAVLDKVGRSADPKTAIAPLQELVKEERQAFVGHDRPRWIRLSAEFHVALAEQAGNPLVVEIMRRLVSRTTLMIASVEAPGHNACSFDEHLDILRALERGDAGAAQAHMAQHLQCCADRVRPEAPADFDLRSVLGRGDDTPSP